MIGISGAHRGFVADGALDHMLMQLPIQVDDGLADAAVDDGHAAGVRAGDGRVGRGHFRCGKRRRKEKNKGNTCWVIFQGHSYLFLLEVINRGLIIQHLGQLNTKNSYFGFMRFYCGH